MAEKGRLWEILGRSVRWDEVMRHAPQIVGVARGLYEKNRQRQQQRPESGPGPGPDSTAGTTARLADLEARLAVFQENEIRQSALIADMAKQLEDLAGGVDGLARRVRIVLWVSGAALAAGIAALVAVLVQ
jgi:uncharacterized coiled-coil protein SlyX